MLDLILRAAMTRCCTVCLVLFVSAGCAGSRSSIVADQASYPVSMTPVVRDSDGRVLGPNDLDVVGEFKFEYRSVHMFYTLIPLSRSHYDLSQEIDQQVKKAGGEAIVDFSVVAYRNVWTLACALLSSGVLPAYSDVAITGEIVRRRSASWTGTERPRGGPVK